ncbi:MAG: DUF1016 N-terminal domain-containing protein [Ignavibacteria bacterium]|nr:DUF1016 N-terminal domain-containing protein [Ignavibacteria bacterium]MDP3832035.1 DUF1016 N-terminal domain-containing protein [Ignavibacteriaceae bacterium]
MSKELLKSEYESLKAQIGELLRQGREQAGRVVNTILVQTYWQIGKRINEEIEGKDRIELYGKEIVATQWRQLTEEYGAAFSEKNLRGKIQFAEVFPDQEIVVSLIRQLSWTHLLTKLPDMKLLQRKLHQSIEIAKNKLTQREEKDNG